MFFTFLKHPHEIISTLVLPLSSCSFFSLLFQCARAENRTDGLKMKGIKYKRKSSADARAGALDYFLQKNIQIVAEMWVNHT